MIDQYKAFLRSKEISDVATGFDSHVDSLNKLAFELQKLSSQWMLRRGRGALFQAPGMGKSLEQLMVAYEIMRRFNRSYLIYAPLAVAHQTVREASKFGIENVKYVRSGAECDKVGIYITNYQMMSHFDPRDFIGVGCDECFAPETEVDCIENGIVFKKRIQYIREGEKIINAFGEDHVKECHRRKVSGIVKVRFGGKVVFSSLNHPWFTQRGWVAARSLRKTDWLLETSTAMQLVQNGVDSKECKSELQQILREVLLSEMAHESAGNSGDCAYEGNARKNRKEEECLVQSRKSNCVKGNGENQDIESNVQSRSSDEGEPNIESDESQTFRAWRKREGIDEATIIALGGVIEWMGTRICRISGKKDSRISDCLQVGYCESDFKDRDRSGREYSLFEKGSGCEEGRYAGFIGLESVEILEQGSPELEQFRSPDGNIYFYDIGLSRHPSFSINGVLVHNSSILKSKEGHYKSELCENWTGIPYRHCYTATPSPNDYAELGNHAEFLGVMSRSEMEATFFFHDGGETSKWTLMPHAQEAFWKWVASWALLMRKPSDIGFSDDGYDLPPLHMHEHVLGANGPTDGFLIAMPATDLTSQRRVKRDSINERCEWAARIASSDEKPHVIWTELNDEGKLLKDLVPGIVDISGADSMEEKERKIIGFLEGDFVKVSSKASVIGYGLNLQFCDSCTTVNVTHSAEDMYQYLRRFYRFGQKNPVNAHLVLTEQEIPILQNVKRKQKESDEMSEKVVKYMRYTMVKNIGGQVRQRDFYEPKERMILPEWIK